MNLNWLANRVIEKFGQCDNQIRYIGLTRQQVKDADNVNHNVVGTHFLDLSNLSNEGEKGNKAHKLRPTMRPQGLVISFMGEKRKKYPKPGRNER